MTGPFAAAMLLGAAALSLAACDDRGQKQTAAPRAAATPAKTKLGGSFTLVDQNGVRVTEKQLLGKPSLVFFGFTFCPEVCPTTLSHMTRWLKELGPDGDKINIFYVTVDPERDTPKQLKTYLTSFDSRIRGLSGTKAQIAEITKNYNVYYKRVPLANGDYVMDHSTMVYMMNGQGRYVGPIGYNEPDDHVMPLLRDLIAGRPPKSRKPDPRTAIERSAT
ncbi:SCO family protein [Sphingomonas sp. PvP056]|uniref:SCO family protein n=1 Tax=Sphingomonas sp. PvP056 TaxID=3156392 RepID=UPI0033907BF6